MSVRQNAEVALAGRGQPVADALQWLRVAGLEDRADAPLGQLSGGQRQRLMLTLARCGHPKVLLLDEPSQASTRRKWRVYKPRCGRPGRMGWPLF